jgi:prokaryotic YEATS domain/TIR domain
MGLRVRLKSEAARITEDWWSWKVWVDGTDEALDQIETVRYLLHPTFPNPIRVGKNRQSKFELSDKGWGEFAITAQVSTKTGETISLEHWIDFKQPGETVGSGRKPSVFLSFSATDRPIVRSLKSSLENQGIEVLSPEDVKIGDTWQSALTEGITRAQVVAFLVSGELRGFAEQELALARQSAKSVVPILVGTASHVPQPFEQLQAMHMRSENDVGPVADLLAARAKDLFYEDEKRSL